MTRPACIVRRVLSCRCVKIQRLMFNAQQYLNIHRYSMMSVSMMSCLKPWRVYAFRISYKASSMLAVGMEPRPYDTLIYFKIVPISHWPDVRHAGKFGILESESCAQGTSSFMPLLRTTWLQVLQVGCVGLQVEYPRRTNFIASK